MNAEQRRRGIVHRYLQGEETLREIARAFGVCPKMVLNAVRDAGHQPNRGHQPKLSDAQEHRMVERYIAGTERAGEIGDVFGVSGRTVFRTLKRSGKSRRERVTRTCKGIARPTGGRKSHKP
jgi:hypothetical protein